MKLNAYWKDVSLRKFLLMMKLFVVLFLVSVMQVSAVDALAQKVSYSGTRVTVKEVLAAIEKQTGYYFFYKDALLQNAGTLTVDFSEKPVDEVLNEICSSLNLIWSVEKQTITLGKKGEPLPAGEEVSSEEPAPPPVKGKVTDEEGNPLPGASVVIKSTLTGTITDANGFFSLEVKSGEKLLVSFVGFTTQEILPGSGDLQIVLKKAISKLDEVQVIAYGTTTKRLSTSSLGSVSSELIGKQPVLNPIQALQGRVAGLSIIQNSGAIGSGMEIQIRGINSIESGTQPLIIIDGAIIPSQGLVASPSDSRSLVPVGGYMTYSGGTTAFNTINPEDVESIEVLKDADATAIYGSRGANGVILITTKRGKAGESRFTVDASRGINMATYIPKRMNLEQYLQMRKDAFAMGLYNPTTGVAINPITPTASNAPDLVSWSQTASTDWPEYEFGNPAEVYKVQANFSGGTRNLNFYLSGGYSKQEDITLGSPYQERFSGRANMNHLSPDEKLRVAFNASYSTDKLKPSKGGGISGGGGLVQSLPPNMPLYDADGSIWWPTTSILQSSLLVNPLVVETVDLESVTNSLISNLEISYKLFKGLQAKAQFGFNNQQNNYSSSSPASAINPKNPGTNIPSHSFSLNNFQTLNFEPQINYSGKLSRGKLEVLLGSTFFTRNTKSKGLVLQGFSTDLLLNSWAAATTVYSKSSTNYYYRFLSLFGRVNYNWESKYLVNLTFRRDGSSRFGPKNKFGNFGAVGLGWLFSNETVVKENLPMLSHGKLRFSFGTTGNDNISEFRFTSLYTASSVYYNGVSGLAATYLSDPSIGWETSNKMDIGLEQGYFKDRVLLTVNWFRTHTTNMLLSQPVASATGFTSFLTNMPGLIENKGWEFELTTQNLSPQSKLQWKTSFNLTLLKNTLLEYPGLANSSQAVRLEIGKPVRSPNIYSSLFERTLQYEGINPDTGMPMYTDVDNNKAYSSADYRYIGSAIPRTFGGLGNTFTWKGLDLDVFIQFSQQLASNHLGYATYPGQLNNPNADWAGNYWKQPGDVSKYPRLYPGTGSNTAVSYLTAYFPISSAGATDLFYARLKNLQLSYTLPASISSKAKMNKVVVYLRGQNLLTWTNKEILKDPETVLSTSMMLKNWSTGIQITF
jgi:TonB-linked SusC/RagA family outer membrane protein